MSKVVFDIVHVKGGFCLRHAVKRDTVAIDSDEFNPIKIKWN